MPSQIGDVALHVATQLGWRCLPVEPGGKIPRLKAWQTEATTDAAKLRKWFNARSQNNLGIATGPGSGIWVLDVDPRNGGAESLAALITEIGPLPQTLTQDTPSGGLHYVFRWPEDGGIKSRARFFGSGLDVRGEGGQFVVQPSTRIDPETGEVLSWLWRNWGTPIADAPIALIARVREHAKLNGHSDRRQPPPTKPEDLGQRRGEAWAMAALDAICSEIANAPAGQQEVTLNGQSLRIGQIVAGGYLPGPYAIGRLIHAGSMMASTDPGDPWIPSVIEAKVTRAIRHGIEKGAAHPPAKDTPRPTLTPIEGGKAKPKPGAGQSGAQGAQNEHAQNARPQPQSDDDRDWMVGLRWHRGPKGGLVQDAHNRQLMLMYDPALRGAFAFDSWAQQTIVRRPLPGRQGGQEEHELDDVDAHFLTSHLARRGIKITPKPLIAEIYAQAADHWVITPLQDWLMGAHATWDQTERMDRVWIDHAGARDDNHGYTRLVGRIFMIGAVARVFRPGCQVDTLPVLEGPQGIKKGTLLRVLADGPGPTPWNSRFATHLGADLRGKDPLINLQGKWITELAELDSYTKQEAAVMKAFITRRQDRFRPPFAVTASDFPRPGVFAGTLNRVAGVGYLTDPTGARRFLPIACGEIRLPTTDEWLQLWGEAVDAYLNGKPWWPETPAETALLTRHQVARYDEDVWTPDVQEWMRTAQGWQTPSQILRNALSLYAATDRTQGNKTRVGKIMTALQVPSGRPYINGDQTRAYWLGPGPMPRPTDEEEIDE